MGTKSDVKAGSKGCQLEVRSQRAPRILLSFSCIEGDEDGREKIEGGGIPGFKTRMRNWTNVLQNRNENEAL